MANPEQRARQDIDALLRAAGWAVQDVAHVELQAARGVAIREFPLAAGHGFADYLLYVDGKACGLIEAKKQGATLTGVEAQAVPEAKVFTLLHELVHLMLARGQEERPALLEMRSADEWLEIERFAEAAACHALLPEDALGLAVGAAPGLDRRWSLAEVQRLLRLPTGLFYAQGVKANVIFFDKKPASETPWTKKLWIYDLRTNKHFTLKTNPLRRADLDEFVELFNPANRHKRKATWSADKPEGRWRVYEYDELIARDKASVDISWLRDETLADSDNLPPPEVIAQEIVDDLEAALEQFRLIAGDLGATEGPAA